MQPDPVGTVGDLIAVRPEARFVVLTAPEADGSGIRAARSDALEYSARPEAVDALPELLAS